MYYAARRNHNGRKLEMDSHCRGINYDYLIKLTSTPNLFKYYFLDLRRKNIYFIYRRVTTLTVTLETCGTQLSVQMQPLVPKTVLLTESTLQLGMAPMELKSLMITHYL